MPVAHLFKYLAGRTRSPMLDIVQSLPDCFEHVSASGYVEEPLICLRILNDRLCLSIHGKHHRTLTLLQVLHDSPDFRRKVVSGWMSLVISSMRPLFPS
jgi:hypothetical protein